jgi:tRNA pseudouridine38-40 synthase
MVSTDLSPEVKPAVNLSTTTKIILVVEYDGTRYHGFQLQANLPTIQRELEKALLNLTGEKIRVMGASRTDAGVHAKAQVVSFKTLSHYPPEIFIKALNYYLPEDIAIKAAHRVSDSFNVQRHAVSREYNYYILNSLTRSPLKERFYYLIPGKLDIDVMNQSCQVLMGRHDFASFVNNNEAAAKGTIRTVYQAGLIKDGELIVFNMVANSFLMHQVRNTIGTLIRVGQGKMNSNEFYSILEAKQPGLAWPTAPARGLCLMRVNYQNYFGEDRC